MLISGSSAHALPGTLELCWSRGTSSDPSGWMPDNPIGDSAWRLPQPFATSSAVMCSEATALLQGNPAGESMPT